MAGTLYMHKWLTLFLFFTFINGIYSEEWLKERFPNPIKDREVCGRFGVKSWICDPDNILRYEDANTLEELLQHISKNTDSQCTSGAEAPGYQVAVAIMDKMAVPDFNKKENVAKEFAKYLHDSWGVGRKDCNDGVLLLISIKDRQVYITTGGKAMEKLENEQIDIVINKMRPMLRDKKYGKALHEAVRLIHQVFSGEELEKDTGSAYVVIFIFLCVFILFGFCISYSNKERQYRKCKEKLETIERERNAAKSSKSFVATSCPICLEDFTMQMNIRSLLCGHKYCESCLIEWLENNPTCPICRQSVNRSLDQPSYDFFPELEFRSSDQPSYDFFPELEFRLTNLQRQYPRYISHALIKKWKSKKYSGRFVDDPAFTKCKPNGLSGNGCHGSGCSFGGGSSSGGGGSGGSW